MKKYVIYGDNNYVYIGSLQQIKFWREEDLLQNIDHRSSYIIEALDDKKEAMLKEEAAGGYIKLFYPRITREKYYQ